MRREKSEATGPEEKADPTLRPAPARTAGKAKARGTSLGMTTFLLAQPMMGAGHAKAPARKQGGRYKTKRDRRV